MIAVEGSSGKPAIGAGSSYGGRVAIILNPDAGYNQFAAV